ncbi:MAG TPA: PA2779 family protein [Dissulfurispiraceae bacterium]
MSALVKSVSWYLVVAMLVIGIVPRVDAAFSPSERIALAQFDRHVDMEKIQKVLEAKMVRDRLAQLGLSPEETRQRLDQLSDSRIHELALNLDQLKVGGDAWGVIVVLIVIAALVVLVLHLTGHRVFVR